MCNQVSVKHNKVVKKAPPAKKPAANWDDERRAEELAKWCLNQLLKQHGQCST